MVFLMVFRSFWFLGPILAHQTAKFKLSGQFCFSRHPCGSCGLGGGQSSGVICIWKIFLLFFGWWRKKCFDQIEAWCHLYYFTFLKLELSLCIAIIAYFLKKYTFWSNDFETFQPKIGQYEQALRVCCPNIYTVLPAPFVVWCNHDFITTYIILLFLHCQCKYTLAQFFSYYSRASR